MNKALGGRDTPAAHNGSSGDGSAVIIRQPLSLPSPTPRSSARRNGGRLQGSRHPPGPFLTIGAGIGVAFAILDGLLNANPVAQRVYAAFRPIAQQTVNVPLGLSFDIISGVVMAALFVGLRMR